MYNRFFTVLHTYTCSCIPRLGQTEHNKNYAYRSCLVFCVTNPGRSYPHTAEIFTDTVVIIWLILCQRSNHAWYGLIDHIDLPSINHIITYSQRFSVLVMVLVVILFPTEYKQWRTKYMSNIITTRKPQTLMILLVVTRETRGSSGWQTTVH